MGRIGSIAASSCGTISATETCVLFEEIEMPQRKKEIIPVVKIPKGATDKQIYAILRKEFTAADLQKFTEIGPMVPAEQLLAEMKAIHEEETRKLKRRKK
jgi:hypothetical protein